MRLALAIASFVILIVHGLVFYNQFFYKWENYQTAYFDQARTLARTDTEKAAIEGRRPRIEQAIVTQFGDTRVDRCPTCHVAMDDPRFDKYAQPLRTHSYSTALGDVLQNGKWERRHKFSDFGCTVCHDGQGRGLTTFYAHGEDQFWPEPLLGFATQANWRKELLPRLKGKEYMEAACAQCHTEENFAGTPNVARGRKLYFATNCYGCHKIEGLSDGTIGPDLSEVGKKWKIEYLWQHTLDPRSVAPTSVMPQFHLSNDDIKALVIFLKSRRGMNFAETSLEHYRLLSTKATRTPEEQAREPVPTGAALLARGQQLIGDHACTACHKLRDRDGGVAPDLSYEGLVRDETWVFDHFKDPRSRISDSIMPAFRFPDEDFRAMAAFLVSQKTPPAPASPADTYRMLCQRCHGEKGDGRGPIALYLDPYPRDLTKAGFINSKTLDRLQNSIRKGVAGTSMPVWGGVLKDDQIQGVLEYVLANFTKDPRRDLKPLDAPDSNPVASSPASIAAGEQIFLQRCTGCHGRKADGKGPNALDILPRPRNLRNSAFINSVADRRLFESILYGVQGTAMPSWVDYGLTRQDVGNVVNFIRSINAPPTSPARSLHARAD